ncbi:MAG: hypothetical protein SGI77_05675 [Pirellulaceae bacterium]|nr:hypothetical protein [Pirellulaceae bacterium]
MSQRANFQQSYLNRYLLLAGVLLPIALWFAYDGFIGYPKELERARKYDPLRELEPKDKKVQWQAIAKENGWSMKEPKKKGDEIADSITGQYVWGSLFLLAGGIALIYYVRSRGSWVELTATGLKTSWGQKMDFTDVTQLDKKKWETKGIAKATYRENTLNRIFVFDDFKFDREPLGKILRQLESKILRSQIVGGPPEPPKNEVEVEKDVKDKSDESELSTSKPSSIDSSEVT